LEIEREANGSLIVRNDDITVNPTPPAAEERSKDAVPLKAAGGLATAKGGRTMQIMTRAHCRRQLRQFVSLEPILAARRCEKLNSE